MPPLGSGLVAVLALWSLPLYLWAGSRSGTGIVEAALAAVLHRMLFAVVAFLVIARTLPDVMPSLAMGLCAGLVVSDGRRDVARQP